MNAFTYLFWVLVALAFVMHLNKRADLAEAEGRNDRPERLPSRPGVKKVVGLRC